MARFTNEEYADMYFVYGFCDGNLAEPRLSTVYVIHFVFRPTVLYLLQFIKSLGETGLFGKVCEVDNDRCSATIEEYIVDRVEENPNAYLFMHTCERSWNFTK